MTTQNKSSRFLKVFGFLYFVFNCMLFTAIFVMNLFLVIKDLEFFPGFIMLILPLAGIYAGYWIRIGKFGWARSIVMALSFLFSLFALFVVFVIGPQMNELKKNKFAQMQAFKLDEDVETIFTAVYVNDYDGVKKALDEGVFVDARNEAGFTPLHVTQDKAILNLLIEKGADVDALDETGMTPMFNMEVELSRILVEAGADIHAKSNKGNTPLMWYCYSGYLDGIKLMVSLGADVNVKNVDGQTAYDIAELFHPLELLEYFKSVDARSGKEASNARGKAQK